MFLKPGVEVQSFLKGSKLSRDKNSETPNFKHIHPETSMEKLLKLWLFFSAKELVTENILQNFEHLSHRGLWTKMLEILGFWVFIPTWFTAFKKKVYFNYRLQKHRGEMLGFSTKNPKSSKIPVAKCIYQLSWSG